MATCLSYGRWSNQRSVFGWYQRWKQAREARFVRIVAKAFAPPPPPRISDSVDALKIINEVTKGRLELEKVQLEADLKRLEVTQKERLFEIELRLKQKERDEKIRQSNSEKMRVVRSHQKNRNLSLGERDQEIIGGCEECASRLEGRKAKHTDHMYRHASERHDRILSKLRQPKLYPLRVDPTDDAATN